MDHKIVALFDFDGVIANTIPALKKAYQCFLESYNKQPTNKEFRELDGPSLTEIVKILKKKHNLPDLLGVLYQRYMQEVDRELKKVCASSKSSRPRMANA